MRAAQARSRATNMLAASRMQGDGSRWRLIAFVVVVLVGSSVGVLLRRGSAPEQAGASSETKTAAQKASRDSSADVNGLSRPTDAWRKLNALGLYDENSGYLRTKAPYKDLEDERVNWETQVMAEYPDNGCKRVVNASGAQKKRCLPKLMIMGQFKAGTTAFYDTLAQHPGIILPYATGGRHKCPMKRTECAIKEVNGFTRLNEGERWKEKLLLERYRDILPEQDLDDDRVVLEASPYYLSGMVDSYEDLTRFTRYIPGFKALVVVRNPIDRAFSDFLMLTDGPFRGEHKGCALGHGIKFEELIKEELAVRSPSLLADPSKKHACLRESNKFQSPPPLLGRIDYKGRLARWGEYAHYAEVWMRVLPPENLLFVKTEALEQNSSVVLPAIQKWIGLKQIIPDMPLVHSNFAGCRGSVARGAWTEDRLRDAAAGLCKGAGPRAPQQHMEPEAVEILTKHFREHNRRFQELTGVSTEDWDLGPISYGPQQAGDKPQLRTRAVRRRARRRASEQKEEVPATGDGVSASAGVPVER